MKVTLYDIRRMVAGGETDRMEFKLKLNHPDKVVREAVAFANTHGGHLMIGIDDNGQINGIKNPYEESYVMQKALADLCRPELIYEMAVVPLTEKRAVLCFHIKKGKNPPYFAVEKSQNRFGKAYVRVGDRTVQASREMRQVLKLKGNEKLTGFAYGENEKLLFHYLGEHNRITLKEFHQASLMPMQQVSEMLVRLVLTNVIRIIPEERADWFEFVE